jgi:alpha-L-fucosidase
VPGHPHYDHHLEHFGHPTEVGYKDVIAQWTADKFDPDGLMDQYVAAGAKYFVSMGVHHDNFDLWDSKHHRWNAAAMGPRRDIVGAWRDAARRRNMRFGVSEHLGASYRWWHPSHGYDEFWPKLGQAYDGADPQFADLYHPAHDEPYLGTAESWYTTNPEFQETWFRRVQDLVDRYEPDLLYTDGGIPFGIVGRSLLAHFYNSNQARKKQLEAVYTCKDMGSGEFYRQAVVQDVERGVLAGINPLPWQTDTSNSDWFYTDDDWYKTDREIIHMLIDIVSKNGNLLLNVVQYPDGSLPPRSAALLASLRDWMAVNAEAIHGTRPWHVFGEGPTEGASGAFKEGADYTPRDIRFTMRDRTLYAISLGEPKGQLVISSLDGRGSPTTGAVRQVRLLGRQQPLSFRQAKAGLVVTVPDTLPSRHAAVFAISFA